MASVADLLVTRDSPHKWKNDVSLWVVSHDYHRLDGVFESSVGHIIIGSSSAGEV
ncbi:MAG: hypothetical protein RL419_1210 [Actinomycetota bacterium]|jgi:hypothetical protein